MGTLTFRLPRLSDKTALADYVREHRSFGETDVESGLGVDSMPYDQWLSQILRNAEVPSGKWGRSLVLLALDGDTLVGLLCIRYELPEEYARLYGHIGYGVRPSLRRRGYASAMLRHALTVCREQGLDEVLLGCRADNIASAKTIEGCGGELLYENDDYIPGRLSRYYRIEL